MVKASVKGCGMERGFDGLGERNRVFVKNPVSSYLPNISGRKKPSF